MKTKTPMTSAEIAKKIRSMFDTADSAQWRLYHAWRWAQKLLAAQQEKVLGNIQAYLGPPAPGASPEGQVERLLEDHRDLVDAAATYRLQGLLGAIEADPAFEEARATYDPLYEQLEQAEVREMAEAARLKQELADLHAEQTKAEAAADVEIARLRKPAEGFLKKARAAGRRLAELGR